MNSGVSSQAIQDCPGLFIDAFRVPKEKIRRIASQKNTTLVLTHYHSDHYGNLPREGKYKGPACIHCTKITARLLARVHQIPSRLVVGHAFGETFLHRPRPRAAPIKITLYDANHCPGAALVLMELPDGRCHLHTGDFRFCPRKTTNHACPRLHQAIQQKSLDLVYLDTTYGNHPKHDFVPQQEAIQTIAETSDRIIRKSAAKGERALILLSCYSIGKEKVLWETSRHTEQPIHVTERKMKMLECVYWDERRLLRTQRATLDPAKSDVHVVPMGLAGELWPYFRPNHKACAEYAEKLRRRYDRIVAFLPTGWAHGSNWNQKNATTCQNMPYRRSRKKIPVEIRLVPYSEHSSFGELQSFVSWLRPRQIIPTVFSDEADRRKILEHFRNLVDMARAKQHFFNPTNTQRDQTKDTMVRDDDDDDDNNSSDENNNSNDDDDDTSASEKDVKTRATSPEVIVLDDSDKEEENDNENRTDNDAVKMLVSMGFGFETAFAALGRHQNNVERALEELLHHKTSTPSRPRRKKRCRQTTPPQKRAGRSRAKGTQNITTFFAPK